MHDLKQQQQMPPRAIPLCRNCHAALDGPDVTDRCPQCGERVWKLGFAGLRDQQFRAGLPRAEAPMATLVPETDSAAPASSNDSLPPVLPPDVTQFYLPAAGRIAGGAVDV